MHITKKIMATVLALLMVLSLPFAVSASDTPLTLVSAHIDTNSTVVLTFSEPIVYTGSPDIRLYTVDENLNSTINNDFPAWSYWWVEITGYYGESTSQLVGTLREPGKQITQSYKAVKDFRDTYHTGKALKFAVWESATGTTASNGYVDNITSTNGAKKLVASKTAARDIAMVDPTEGTISPIVNQTLSLVSAHVTSNTEIVLTFSEPIVYTGTLDIRLYTVDENLNSTINNDFPAWSYWWVSIQGYYMDSTYQLVGTLREPGNQNAQSFQAVKNFRDTNYPGKALKFAIWESETGTTAANGLVDNITSTDGLRKLAASKTATRDIAMVEPTEGPVPNTGDPLTLVGAFVNPKATSQIVLTFSEPITYTGSLDIRLYTVDENLNSTINNNFPVWSYWWVQVTGYYGSSSNQLIGTLKVPDSQNNQNYTDVANSVGANAANLRFAVWESATDTTPANGYVDNITSANGTKKLVAAKTATRDIAMVAPSLSGISVTSIKVLNDKVGQITFSEGITEGIYRSDATAWKSIRLTNDKFELQKYDPNNANAWLQWGITMQATDDPAVWNFTINGGYQSVTTFSQLVNMVKPGGAHAGLKITFAIEQLCQNGDLTNILDNITSLDGVRPISATNDNTTSWLDGLYVEINMPPTPLVYTVIDDTHARILLASKATLGSGMPAVGQTAATALTVEGGQAMGTSFIATFPAGVLRTATEMTIPAGVFVNELSVGNQATTLSGSGNAFGALTEGKVTLEAGKAYSFMNADTGREILVNGQSEFTATLVDADKSLYSFGLGEQYLDLTAPGAALAANPVSYQLVDCGNGRYQIFAAPTLAVCDTDAGTSNAATLSLLETDTIATGWYLTKSGETKPLRILPLGDSITYGTNPDTTAPRMGWRDDLSTDLADKLDRYVFVGNQVTKITSVTDAELARHEGNPGWTVKDHGDRNGIYDLVAPTVTKYDPDVVLLMIGINDMAVYASGGFSTSERDEMKTNYRDLVVALSANMDGSDTIFCSRLTPMSNGHSMFRHNMPETFNDTWGFNSWVAEWAAEGLPVKLNDNYAALAGKTGVICSDGIHLSVDGDPFVAQAYANSIMATYNADGSRIKADVAAPAAPTAAGKTATSVTLTAVDGYEYKMNDGAWTTDPRFEDLDPNTAYTFYQRVAETATAKASPASAALTVTTNKLDTAAPAAPILYSKTGISVTLTAVDGYEYKMNDGAWTADPRFEDLDPNTAYTFYQRVAETATAKASPASAALTVTTNKLDSGVVDPPTVLEKTHNSVTLVANDRYEYKLNDGAWTTNPVFTGLEPETAYTFYQRVRENDIEYAGPTSEGTVVTTNAKPLLEEGWQLNAVGWWYQYSDGSYPSNGWAFIGESWYYFNAGGYMMTGWLLDGNTWYYLQDGGAMHTGWLLNGGTWYYMNASGAMATGWVNDGGTWYYMNASGAMMTGWVNDGGTWYYMNASGVMVTGWLSDGGTWYYMNPNGAMATGWVNDGGTWYYMNPNGAMATGWILDNGVWYLLSASGAWVG